MKELKVENDLIWLNEMKSQTLQLQTECDVRHLKCKIHHNFSG